MGELLNDETLAEIRSILSELTAPVELVHFSQDPMSPNCSAQLELLRTIEPLSDKLTLTHYDLVHNRDEAREYDINKVPATAVIGRQDYGIRFYGLTSGYEFNSLIEDILMVSSGDHGLDPVVMELLSKIDKQELRMAIRSVGIFIIGLVVQHGTSRDLNQSREQWRWFKTGLSERLADF